MSAESSVPEGDTRTLKPEVAEADPVLRERLRARLFPGTSAPPTIGRFQITGELGRGGMGVVYAGFDPELRRPVAVKLLSAATDDTQARLRREARAMARVSHPNVASVYDFGEHEGRLFIAMEFVDGKTLDAWMAEARPGLWQLLDAFAQAARGLVAAHAEGLVHRDFKPSNAMVAADGRVRVLDFGLARTEAFDGDEAKLLETTLEKLGSEVVTRGGIAGTPAYMAPEQLRGKAATAKTDQFAFCVSLFEALHGVRPYEGPTFADLVAHVITNKRREVDDAKLPPWLKQLIDKGLSSRAEDRFETMDALIAALDAGRLEGGLGVLAPRRASMPANIRLVATLLVAGLALAVGIGVIASLSGISARLDLDALRQGLIVGVVLALGAVFGAGLYLRGSLTRFGRPRVTRSLRTSVPAERVLELLVRNAGRLDYVIDDQDFFARRLCLRVRAGVWSVGAYVRVEIESGDPTNVVLGSRPILPGWADWWWRSQTDAALARIEGLLGDDRPYPPSPP